MSTNRTAANPFRSRAAAPAARRGPQEEVPLARSRVTKQGQISIPAEVRKELGIRPGSTIEWRKDGDSIVVRKSGAVTFEDIHRVLFPDGPPQPAVTVEEMDAGIEEYMRTRHAPAKRR